MDLALRIGSHIGYGLYHLFTTLIALTQILLLLTVVLLFALDAISLNYAVWIFVFTSMLLIVIKICLQHLFQPHPSLNESRRPQRC